MRLEAQKYLFDIQRAAALLTEFTAEKAFADYAQNPMRAAVEREFEVIGEAHRPVFLAQDVFTNIDGELRPNSEDVAVEARVMELRPYRRRCLRAIMPHESRDKG